MARTASELARQELVDRETSRRSLIAFTERFTPEYVAGWAHKLIAANLEKFLEDCIAKKSPRLMLFLPPRFGKSVLASKNFPAWALGHHPTLEFIVASYATSLPMDFSRYIKGLLDDPAYRSMFPDTRLDPKAQATDGWYTTASGCYVPSGVGSGITGRGAHCLIIDDPVKDAEQADSETVLEKAWDWYGSTAMTRVAPGGGILVIQTRWSDRDLAGMLLASQAEQEKELREQIVVAENPHYCEYLENELENIERWQVLSFPAVATQTEYITPELQLAYEPQPGFIKVREKDQAVHPVRFDEAAFKRIKRGMAPRHWSALYQQNPVPEEGAYFQKIMYHESNVIKYPEFPVLQAWDFAIGQKQTNDWTVGVTGFLDYEGVLHIIDLVRFRGNTFEIVDAIASQHQKHHSTIIGLEQGHISMTIMPVLEAELKKRRLHPLVDDELKTVSDKVMRARPLQGMMQRGMVAFKTDTPWFQDMRGEMLRFPNAIYDDQVDALSHLARLAMDTPLPQKKKRKGRKSWRDKLKQATYDKHNNHLQA